MSANWGDAAEKSGLFNTTIDRLAFEESASLKIVSERGGGGIFTWNEMMNLRLAEQA